MGGRGREGYNVIPVGISHGDHLKGDTEDAADPRAAGRGRLGKGRSREEDNVREGVGAQSGRKESTKASLISDTPLCGVTAGYGGAHSYHLISTFHPLPSHLFGVTKVLLPRAGIPEVAKILLQCKCRVEQLSDAAHINGVTDP